MPSVWSARNTLYKVSLVVLIVGVPVHLVSILIPYWLELVVSVPAGQENVNIDVNYGLWQICLRSQGCYGVYSTNTGAVGGWFVSVQTLMMWAFVLHICAALLGALQNFLSRTHVRTWRSTFWRRVVHRDCELPEDIGFAAGFLGQAAHIIFMLFTKEQVSNGATYSWAFAFGFLATGGAVLATLALTKSRTQPLPRPAPPRVRPVELQDVNLRMAEPHVAEEAGGGMAETDLGSHETDFWSHESWSREADFRSREADFRSREDQRSRESDIRSRGSGSVNRTELESGSSRRRADSSSDRRSDSRGGHRHRSGSRGERRRDSRGPRHRERSSHDGSATSAPRVEAARLWR